MEPRTVPSSRSVTRTAASAENNSVTETDETVVAGQIRNADVAEAWASLARDHILTQRAVAALAQAHQRSWAVLALLS
jgi:flagellin-like hook-associated protein FlgL